jgi:hypothetical protein
MVQCTVGLFTAVPSTLVHALDLFISTSRSLVLLGTWDGDERVDLRRVRTIVYRTSDGPRMR